MPNLVTKILFGRFCPEYEVFLSVFKVFTINLALKFIFLTLSKFKL